MPLYVGVDPGENGALAVIEAEHAAVIKLIDVVSWSPNKENSQGFACRSIVRGAFSVDDLVELSPWFEGATGVAIEGLFVGNARQRIIGTAETAGSLISASVTACPNVSIDRPLASKWRAQFLRLPSNTRASQCDSYARKVVKSIFPLEKKITGHGVDAVCIALWEAGIRGSKR